MYVSLVNSISPWFTLKCCWKSTYQLFSVEEYDSYYEGLLHFSGVFSLCPFFDRICLLFFCFSVQGPGSFLTVCVDGKKIRLVELFCLAPVSQLNFDNPYDPMMSAPLLLPQDCHSVLHGYQYFLASVSDLFLFWRQVFQSFFLRHVEASWGNNIGCWICFWFFSGHYHEWCNKDLTLHNISFSVVCVSVQPYSHATLQLGFGAKSSSHFHTIISVVVHTVLRHVDMIPKRDVARLHVNALESLHRVTKHHTKIQWNIFHAHHFTE